jgi:D-inositol-3-phosphate glycosyltransferase
MPDQNKATNKQDLDGRLRCMVIMDQLPGFQLAKVRRPTNGFTGWLERTSERLARDIRPEIQLSTFVRGARIAQDNLIEALYQHSQLITFGFIVANNRQNEFEKWADAHSIPGRTPIKIYPITQLLNQALDNVSIDIWFNIHGDTDGPLTIRNQYSNSVYPTATVLHGISSPSYLYERFLRTMLVPHYQCDSIICTSRACKKAVDNIVDTLSSSFNSQFNTEIRFNGRLDMIPLCVDTDRLRPGNKSKHRKSLGIQQDKIVMLYIGYLCPSKADLTPLLSIIQTLVDRNPTSQLLLIIAGTGPESYRQTLSDTVRELELEKNVTFMREVSDSLKEQLLGAADIFVAPCDSMQESFGLTPVEAMSCGLPQVVADWDGYRDTVLHGETGFLVPTYWGRCETNLFGSEHWTGWQYDHVVQGQSIAFDVASMREYLQLLISNSDLRSTMSARSRDRAVAEFSHASLARRYDELWQELTSISAMLHLSRERRSFDRGNYFSFFGHFATTELKDEYRVRKAASNRISIHGMMKVAEAELKGFKVFEEQLLNDLMIAVNAAEDASLSPTVGQIISLMSTGMRNSDMIRRHLLLLIKHGKISVS